MKIQPPEAHPLWNISVLVRQKTGLPVSRNNTSRWKINTPDSWNNVVIEEHHNNNNRFIDFDTDVNECIRPVCYICYMPKDTISDSLNIILVRRQRFPDIFVLCCHRFIHVAVSQSVSHSMTSSVWFVIFVSETHERLQATVLRTWFLPCWFLLSVVQKRLFKASSGWKKMLAALFAALNDKFIALIAGLSWLSYYDI